MNHQRDREYCGINHCSQIRYYSADGDDDCGWTDERTVGGWMGEVSVRMPEGGWSTTAPSVTGDSAHSTNNNDNRTGRRSFVSLS